MKIIDEIQNTPNIMIHSIGADGGFGVELKNSYFLQAVANLKNAEDEKNG